MWPMCLFSHTPVDYRRDAAMSCHCTIACESVVTSDMQMTYGLVREVTSLGIEKNRLIYFDFQTLIRLHMVYLDTDSWFFGIPSRPLIAFPHF